MASYEFDERELVILEAEDLGEDREADRRRTRAKRRSAYFRDKATRRTAAILAERRAKRIKNRKIVPEWSPALAEY